ncbi:MAG TPA: dihydroorotase [Bacteroidales bacterium]|nr:dihydroorotase [Bacteroidales bacterium]
MNSILIKNATIVNESRSFTGDLLIQEDLISAVGSPGQLTFPEGTKIIDASNKLLLPGIIDTHVHFRDPGLTHKGDIFTESRAAAAGGITSFMDMPNTLPQTITKENLEDKFRVGAEKSLVNYSFYIGATNTNMEEVLTIDPCSVCGLKIFLGSSTGDMLTDNEETLRILFREANIPVVVHCEDENIIRKNTSEYKTLYGENLPFSIHPLIRSREACFKSSSYAVRLAKEYNTRLHILHLSTADEIKLFDNMTSVVDKRITGETCINHLWFDDSDYDKLGSVIKCNPAVKTCFDREALRQGINNNLLDTIATDHAPHTTEEKANPYLKSPSGVPMIQHSLPAMLELWHNNVFSIEKIIEKMCHNPALIFNIKSRGFIREGYKADLCLVDPDKPWEVTKQNILYKCRWSPFEGKTFKSKIIMTIVNGTIVYNEGSFNEDYRGERLTFDR